MALGTLSIQVNFASGAPAAGRQVQISRTGFQGPFLSAGSTDTNGHLNVANFPATSAIVRVFHPLSPTVPTEVVAFLETQGQIVPVDVTLPIVNVINGKVTLPTGAPAVGTTVQLRTATSVNQATTTDSSGNYSFTIRGVPLNFPWTVRAFNPGQTILFKDVPVTFTADNVATTVNITLPAIASLRVTAMLGGSPLVGARVQIKSAFDTFFVNSGVTDSTGTRIVPNVPEGLVLVQLLDGPTFQLLGLATITIGPGHHGQTIDVPFAFDTTLPVELFDGNGMRFDIQRDGTLRTGTNGAFAGSGGQQLFFTDPFGRTFIGAPVASTEESGREVTILQAHLSTVVTRKIYVPSDGYFTRYLEIFRNTTAAAVTIRPSIFSSLGANSTNVDSSDGDSTFTTADNWVITDDGDVAPQTRPAMAFVANGDAALVGLETTGVNNPTWGWSPVTIQPGQSAIFMHFASQQTTRAGALAAAQRLTQLPPEALAGLSAEERGAIVNWIVPADGVSQLAPLPARTGAVSGRSITGDGVTGAALSRVTLTSPNHPYFTPKTVTADTNGQFAFANVALDTFALHATDALTSVTSPTANGSFTGGQTTAARDVVFTNTGVVRGLVRRLGLPVAGAPVSLFGSAISVTVTTGADGRYVLPGLPAGSYTLLSQVVGSGGAVAQVVNGQTTTADITIGSGRIQGRVTMRSGSVAVGAPVVLIDPTGTFPSPFATTDSAGRYEFVGVTLGLPYTVQAGHPTIPVALAFSAPVTVTSDGQTVTADVTLPAVANVRVTVVESNGTTPVPFPFISIDREDGNGFQPVMWGDADGIATIENVSGDFTVRATDDAGVLGFATGTVAPNQDGTVIDVTITATGGLATVSGTVYATDGITPLPDDNRLVVELIDVASGNVIQQQSRGQFSFVVRVTPLQEIALVAHSPLDFATSAGPGFTLGLSPDDNVVGLDMLLPVPVVWGTVLFSDGSVVPFPNVSLELTAPNGESETFFATRNNGVEYGIPVLRLGDFALTAQDPDSGLSETVTGTVANPTDVINQDVTLPEGATVIGSVFDNGEPVSAAAVTLISQGATARTVFASAGGFFSFGSSVPPGPIRLQACNSLGACSSQVAFAEVGGFLNVTLTIQAGQVFGQVLDEEGSSVGNATVSAYNRSDSGLSNVLAVSSDGEFFFQSLPAGVVTIAAFAPGSTIGGVTETILEPGGSAFVDVHLNGTATKFDYPLDSDASRFVVRCDGGAWVGPNGDTAVDASTLQFARPNGTSLGTFPCLPFAALVNSREPVLDAGYVDGVGLEVARKVFVPEEGGFVRYLEVLTNPGPVDVTVRVRVSGTINELPTVTLTPAETNNTHALLNDGDAILGLVFGGYDAPVQAVSRIANGVQTYSYEWTVTIPAEETRRLLHFVVQGQRGFPNYAVAASWAAALAELNDEFALAGLSFEEKATIVNFVIQP